MKITIKEVDRCRDNSFGKFVRYGLKAGRIHISLSKNPTLAEYAATLLHELLHLWVFMLNLKGYRLSEKKEHKFIYEVERILINSFSRVN